MLLIANSPISLLANIILADSWVPLNANLLDMVEIKCALFLHWPSTEKDSVGPQVPGSLAPSVAPPSPCVTHLK